MPPQTVTGTVEIPVENSHEAHADNKPRISREFTGNADDDDNLMKDDYDPNDEPETLTKENVKVPDKEDRDRNTSSKFWTKLSKQLTNMLKDDDEFEN